MTAFALPAETAVMHIVAIVTTAATSRQTDLTVHRPFVAGLARDADVAAIEFEGALFVVVKNPCLPVTRVVTQSTVRAEGALVRIVFGVTGIAL